MLDGAAGAEPGTRSRPPGPAPCSVRSPVTLQVGDAKTDLARPGVAVIDVALSLAEPLDLHLPAAGSCYLLDRRASTQISGLHLQEIVFKNSYTAFLTVRVQRRRPCDARREGSRKWATCLRNHCLMPTPHTEDGSQDYFSLVRQQMLCEVDQVTAVRLILRQPSPVWLHFTLEELQLYPRGQKSPQRDFPSWLSHLAPQRPLANLQGGIPDPEKVSAEVQRLWVLTEMIRANQAAARIGRFDVDGCYDINLLSYT